MQSLQMETAHFDQKTVDRLRGASICPAALPPDLPDGWCYLSAPLLAPEFGEFGALWLSVTNWSPGPRAFYRWRLIR